MLNFKYAIGSRNWDKVAQFLENGEKFDITTLNMIYQTRGCPKELAKKIYEETDFALNDTSKLDFAVHTELDGLLKKAVEQENSLETLFQKFTLNKITSRKICELVDFSKLRTTKLHFALHRDLNDIIAKEVKTEDLNATDSKNRTPLQIAVEKINILGVFYLLEKGAKPQQFKIENEITPINGLIELYRHEDENRHKKIVSLLVPFLNKDIDEKYSFSMYNILKLID